MFVIALITLQIVLSVYCQTADEIQCLKVANNLRGLHQNTRMMDWNSELASAAQDWADNLTLTDRFVHDSNRGGAGENIFKMTAGRAATCADAELRWYEEFENYDYATHKSTNEDKAVGHFTQVVWEASTQLGVGLSKKTLPDGYIETIIVARYNPAGNFYIKNQRDEFYADNVRERKTNAVTPTLYELDPSLCADFNDLCPAYEQHGYCDIVKSSCPVSCEFC